MELTNPIANRGTIVVDPARFIGRQKELALIRRRVVENPNLSNLAIIAEKGLGGSSLAHQAIFAQKEELREKGTLLAGVNCQSFDSPEKLFQEIVEQLRGEAEQLKQSDIIDKLDQALLLIKLEKDWENCFQMFLKILSDNEIKAFLILDEFDEKNLSFLKFLKEIIRLPDYRAGLAVISRRPIRDIEKRSDGFSLEFSQGFDRGYNLHLDEIFEDQIHLKPFNEEELSEYYKRLSDMPLKVEHIERINYYCGGWPLLMNILCHEVFEDFREEQKVDIDAAYQKIKDRFLSHYHILIQPLKNKDRLETLLQILLNRAGSEKKDDIDEFLRRGIIKPKKDNEGYHPYSKHFEEYLRLVYKSPTREFLKSRDELENVLAKLAVKWIARKDQTSFVADRLDNLNAKSKDSKRPTSDAYTLDRLLADSCFNYFFPHFGMSKESLLKRIKTISETKEKIDKNDKIPELSLQIEIKIQELDIARKYCEELTEETKKILDAEERILIKRAGDYSDAGLPIAINKLAIQNYYDIKEIELNLSREAQWIFLTGENGYGKTLLLRAIVIALNGGKAEWGGGNLAPEGFNAGVELFEDNSARLHNLGNPFFTPFKTFAAYGPSRLKITHAGLGEEEARDKIPPTYGVFNTDGALLNIERRLLDLHKLSKENNHKSEKSARKLKTLKSALLRLLSGYIEEIDTSDVKVYYREVNAKDKRPLKKLASGLVSLIGMIGDILIRLSGEEQDSEELKGIVIIDELDLHLHPKLQKQLPERLTDIFPQVQFIASTHSPIPMLGAPKNSIFLKVTRNEQNDIEAELLDVHDITRLHPNLLLSSPIFDMEEIFHAEKESIDLVKTEDSWKEMLENEEVRASLAEKLRAKRRLFSQSYEK